MRQNKLNKHGQPFSKKQKKASRTMMKLRGFFIPKAPTGQKVETKASLAGKVLAAIAKIKGQRR